MNVKNNNPGFFSRAMEMAVIMAETSKSKIVLLKNTQLYVFDLIQEIV